MAEELALVGGGCFWCTEAVFKDVRGVTRVTSGYAGGTNPNPTYREVCTGRTGHAEVVQIAFDPEVVSYADLLRVFFATHDPTTKDRQGNDTGTQYRSVIYAADAAQAETARAIVAEMQPLWGKPIVTELAGDTPFYAAEPEHHDYFARNPYAGYCQAVVAPKVAKFRKEFSAKLRA